MADDKKHREEPESAEEPASKDQPDADPEDLEMPLDVSEGVKGGTGRSPGPSEVDEQ